jgi:hypothetical protein
MATTTTNFGWDIPQSTDLVKDGATAIAALGQDIDTALVDLKGGTTGQVLAKASGTDLDFSWVAQDDSNAIQNAIVDAKGDLIGATAADTPARLAVGTNGQVLTADSTAATGLAWATPAGAAVSGCSLFKSADQSCPNDSGTTVTFDSEAFDTDAYHSTSTNTSRITIPAGKAGKFLLIGRIDFAANSTGQRHLNFIKNGSFNTIGLWAYQATAAGTGGAYASVVVDAADGDYYEISAYQNSGSAVNMRGSSIEKTIFQAIRLG